MSDNGWKTKTIRKVLSAKLNQWIKSIDSLEVREAAKKDSIVTGGSIVSMLMGDEIKDFDIYFKTEETTKLIAQYYCNKFVELNPGTRYTPLVFNTPGRVEIHVAGGGILESEDADDTPEGAYESDLGEGGADYIAESILNRKPKEEGTPPVPYRPIFLSQNAITLSDKIQLVIRFFGTPDEIHQNYDFEHCKNVYDHDTNELTLKVSALESIMSKTLIYTGSLYPICSLFRMRKFIDRGWRISAGEILKMAWQVNALDLTDRNVIKEQLTGCDQAYMSQLIRIMNKDCEENPEKSIDSLYIVDLVDKVFNT